MPYITRDAREMHNPLIAQIVKQLKDTTRDERLGEINYIFTKIILGAFPEQRRYCDYNNAIGILECCKMELYRRFAVPYEESKIQINGDL